MLILILIDIKYLQSVAFRFGKGSSGQNYSLSDSQHPINSPPSKITHSSLRLNIFEKSSMKKARVILNHHPAKFGGHRHCGSGDNAFSS